MKITATIITYNEAENVRAACDSVAWADELIVVDAQSTDNTRDLAAECGARVISRAWPGFALQKQFAVEQASNDWIFSLDADERVSDELKASIDALRDRANPAAGYLIARRSFYQGRWIKGGGWYPDRQLRLFNRLQGRWEERQIHESVKLSSGARLETLSGDILHYSISNAAHHHRMIGERYAPLAAKQMLAEGRRGTFFTVATAGPAAFLRAYILKGGFRDGLAGLSIASFAAHHAFLKHLILWEMTKDNLKDQRPRI